MQLELFDTAAADDPSVSIACAIVQLAPCAVIPDANTPTTVEGVQATSAPPAFPLVDPRPLVGVETLDDLLTLYGEPTSDHPARVKIRSAIRCVGRVLRQPLDQLPADPGRLRLLLAAAVPAEVGVKPIQWRDVRYILGRGMRDAGVAAMALRDDTPLAPDWTRMSDELKDRKLEIGLTKFMRYCTRRSLAPEAVTAACFVAFREESETHSLHADPSAVYRQTIKLWNRAARDVPVWPKLVVSCDTDARRYALPWEGFATSLVQEVEEFLATKEHGDVFADGFGGRVKAVTTRGRRQSLRRWATALVKSGVPIASVTNLAALCQIEHVRLGLAFLRERRGGRLNDGDIAYAQLMLTIARNWLQDLSAAAEIKKLISQVSGGGASRQSGMKPKNRRRLRQFDILENHQDLIGLPEKVRRSVARKSDPTYAESVRVMYALMIAVLMRIPMRSKNLVELELGDNLIDMGKGRRRLVKIYLAGWQTKTGRQYEAPLSPEVFGLLDDWVNIHRRRICPTSSTYLFPNSRGELRSRDGVATQLTNFIRRETGLQMHLHLFRHLAAKTILDRNPSGMEAARQILGHSTTRTTEKAYADFQTDPSFRELDKSLEALRSRPLRKHREGRFS